MSQKLTATVMISKVGQCAQRAGQQNIMVKIDRVRKTQVQMLLL